MKIAIVGASGRMGRMLIESVLKDGSVELVAAIDQPLRLGVMSRIQGVFEAF